MIHRAPNIIIYLNLFFVVVVSRNRHTKQKKKCMLKTHLRAVYDCKTSQIILNLICMHIRYIDDLYHIGRIVAFATFSK